jgi:hypothetical protein
MRQLFIIYLLMNVFTYTKGVNAAIRTQIIEWSNKNQEYLRLIYDGDIFRAQGASFGDCISKVEYLIEIIFTEPQYFRGIQTLNGRLQAGAIIDDYSSYLYIDAITNALWNVIKNQPQTVKGAATSLVEGIIQESIEMGYQGRLRLLTIERAKPFYKGIGFVDDEDSSGGMELTPVAAEFF